MSTIKKESSYKLFRNLEEAILQVCVVLRLKSNFYQPNKKYLDSII